MNPVSQTSWQLFVGIWRNLSHSFWHSWNHCKLTLFCLPRILLSKIPDPILRLTVYSMFTVPFALWAQNLCSTQVLEITVQLIAWLPNHIPSTETDNIEEFANPHWVYRTQSWFQLRAQHPTQHRFPLFVPPILQRQIKEKATVCACVRVCVPSASKSVCKNYLPAVYFCCVVDSFWTFFALCIEFDKRFSKESIGDRIYGLTYMYMQPMTLQLRAWLQNFIKNTNFRQWHNAKNGLPCQFVWTCQKYRTYMYHVNL